MPTNKNRRFFSSKRLADETQAKAMATPKEGKDKPHPNSQNYLCETKGDGKKGLVNDIAHNNSPTNDIQTSE